jgi:hypothetical protein
MFLQQFATPTLLWGVLSSVGYLKAPRYTWEQAVPHGTLSWYDVRLVVPPHPERPLWHGWGSDSDGQTPWEGAQVAALAVLMDIC